MQTDDDEIINKICDYAEQYQVKDMLQEYLKRVILAKPRNPVEFLIKTIQENPYTLPENNDDENQE